MKKRRAFFITVEGLEGSGKSSVISFFKNWLEERGFSVRFFREPGSTYIGEKIREILLDRRNRDLSPHTELLLYLAARTQLIEEALRQASTKYDFVVCDRFFDSTLVYQGYALGLGPLVDKAVRLFSLGLRPDLTLLLDAPPEEGLSRLATKDRIESRPISFHRKLRRGYLALAKKYPNRIKVIDARGDLEGICLRVERVLRKNIRPLRQKARKK
jgi:dTMP kinase